MSYGGLFVYSGLHTRTYALQLLSLHVKHWRLDYSLVLETQAEFRVDCVFRNLSRFGQYF